MSAPFLLFAQWKAPVLWGIGLFEKTNGIPYYLPDGRARSLPESDPLA
jgi:CxxC motif-containing protein (DUF1111 family)